MTEHEWHSFSQFRAAFKTACIHWLAQCGYRYAAPDEHGSCVEKSSVEKVPDAQTAAVLLPNIPQLHLLQQEAAAENKTPAYPVETPIVYNHSLDTVTEKDKIKLIIISDNPGKNEQLHKNQRYLVGQAGKVAEGFFRRHPQLGIDFRREAIILNKTPVHTAKTKELGFVLKHGGENFRRLFEETQVWLAHKTAELQQALGCPLWLVGYGELRKKSFFTVYAEALRKQYENRTDDPPVFVFQHFSMNCFLIDYNKYCDDRKTVTENLRTVGLLHRKEILGW